MSITSIYLLAYHLNSCSTVSMSSTRLEGVEEEDGGLKVAVSNSTHNNWDLA